MAEVLDFTFERAKRKSGISDTSVLRNIIKEGYDPCDPVDVQNYYEWLNFQGMIHTDIDSNWTDEAIQKLFDDINNFNTDDNLTTTVEYNAEELLSGDDFNLDYTTFSPNKT